MAQIARARDPLPAPEGLLGHLAHREDFEISREATQHRFQRRAALRDLGEARLAIARRAARSQYARALLAIRMPREGIPQDDLEGFRGSLDLAPNDEGAALALRFCLGVAAGEHQRLACDEPGLVDELGLGAERDAGEAAAAMAGCFAQQHHARVRPARLEVRSHVLAAHLWCRASRRAIPLVRVAPRIEDTRQVCRPLLQQIEKIFQLR